MQARAEVTGRYAHQYVVASKKVKGQILDEVVGVTGWSRDNARRRLVAADRGSLTVSSRKSGYRTKQPVRRARKRRARKYGYDTLRVLVRVWTASGKQCGKYLVVVMGLLLDNLERHGELVFGADHYSPQVRCELLSMSAATIDRYLAPTKTGGRLKGISTTKPSPLLRNSIRVRKAGDEVEAEPGFFEVDTVAHCGPTTRGEYARTLNMTDVLVGWTFTRSIRNNARVHIQWALQQAHDLLPYPLAGVDFDNGSEFINHDIVGWAVGLDLFFTRSRPHKKNDQATIESKNGHLVRRYADYWRYDTPETLQLLNQMWPLVNDLLNYLTPTKKPIGWDVLGGGKKKRVYDTPTTPLDRLLRAGILSPAQQQELNAYRDNLNPADLVRRIRRIQIKLAKLGAPRTEQLRRTLREPTPINVQTGIILRTTTE